MRRLLYLIWIFGLVSTFSLSGCKNGEEVAPPNSPETSSSTLSENVETSVAEGTTGLSSIVSKTQVAVESGNFPKAKQEFDKFEESWKTVEDGIKAKSPESYDAIEESLDTVTLELKKSTPNKNKVLTELQSLKQNIDRAVKL